MGRGNTREPTNTQQNLENTPAIHKLMLGNRYWALFWYTGLFCGILGSFVVYRALLGKGSVEKI